MHKGRSPLGNRGFSGELRPLPAGTRRKGRKIFAFADLIRSFLPIVLHRFLRSIAHRTYELETESQDELVEELRNAGFNVTQATVSRDIKELHLVKVPLADGRYKYSLPAVQRFNPLQKLKRNLMDVFVSIDSAGHLIVMKTLPGNANAIGALIDHLDWDEILGTICGDDTILIICRTEKDTEIISEKFLEML